MKEDINHLTFDVPRFLSFIDLAYLWESIELFEKQIIMKLNDSDGDKNNVGNINATKQAFLRSAFISAFAIFEQNLDEICYMEKNKKSLDISPSDLKDRGVRRSIKYANKILGYEIDESQLRWKVIFELQEVRNHLVHYGSNVKSDEHYKKLSKLDLVSLRPSICFDSENLSKIFDFLVEAVNDFISE